MGRLRKAKKAYKMGRHAIGYYNLKGFFICYANTGLHEYKFRDFNVTIKYVHQLQNLYFALTQEELTISE